MLLAAHSVLAQEVLAPLLSRPATAALVAPKHRVVLELPFFDDFSDYEGRPDSARWLSTQAFVNKDYAPLPPTVGMVTLDALDGDGNLYPQASTNLFTADTLASQTIRLDSLTGAYQQRLQPSDSIILSFFYVPGGWYGNPWELVGDEPSTNDSLFLDFYDAQEEMWHVVWATPGFNADTAGIRSLWPWRYASVTIDDPRYLTDQFRFRFRNYASLDPNPKSGISGNCDHWNIDYVYLNRNRTSGDSLFRDVAFVEKAPSMLKNYQSMPARQFAGSDMAQRIEMKIVNRYSQTLSSTYAYTVYDETGGVVKSYNGGYENIPAFYPFGQYQNNAVHSNPPIEFTYPVSGQPAEFRIVHVVREGVGGDSRSGNDTVAFRQRFADYYAYDDGVPENGYGLTAPGSKMWFACRYDLRVEDTLTALRLCFNRTRDDENEGLPFKICVWKCSNGLPSTLLYEDETRMEPQFDGMNRFHNYKLTKPLVVSDTVFIGIVQLSNGFINLGFDRNNDARQFTYYRTDSEWMQSILKGAVMMRPAFGVSGTVGMQAETVRPALRFFTNPTSSQLTVCTEATAERPARLQIFDIQGRCRMTALLDSPSKLLDLGLESGVYILRLQEPNGTGCTVQKLIVK